MLLINYILIYYVGDALLIFLLTQSHKIIKGLSKVCQIYVKNWQIRTTNGGYICERLHIRHLKFSICL